MVTLIRFATGFLTVLGAYFLYVFLVVPLIDGEVEKSRFTPKPLGESNNQRYEKLLTSIFPEDDWIRGRCKILDAKQSILFFKEAKQLESGDWEVKPFTMFLVPETAFGKTAGTQQELPIILRTEEGAFIRFDDGGSPNSPSGKFSSARMPGKVTVIRESTSAEKPDNFEFVTRNIQVNKKQIIAVNPVTFKYGEHYGSGHNLTINLAASENQTNRRLPLVRNLKTIELAHLNEIILQPSEGIELLSKGKTSPKRVSTVPTMDPGIRHGTSEPGGREIDQLKKSPVRVTCTGPFRLDFGKSQMVLFDKVHLEHLHQTTRHDHLYCDRLHLDFAFEKEPGTAEPSASQTLPDRSRKIKFLKMVASGSPARLLMDSRDVYVHAESIDYSVQKQQVVCRTGVVIRDHEHQFSAPEIQYQLNEDGSLGTGWATGPGRIVGHPDDPKKHFVASWNSELNIQPHDGKKAISLHGNAHIVYRQNQHFRSDELHFWLWERHVTQPKSKWLYFPAQMLGRSNVSLDAPQFAGQVNEIRAFWPRAILSIPEERLDGGESTGTQQNPQTSLVSQTREVEAGGTSKPVTNRMIVNGNLAVMNLNSDSELVSARLTDRVNVKSFDMTSLDQEKQPTQVLDVTGNEIQVNASTKQKETFKITVLGTPANVNAEGVEFKSETLIIDQETNYVWSDLPGKMLVSPKVRNPQAALAPEPETTITWKKRFEFDGQLIRLLDDVRFNGVDYLKSGEQVTFSGETPQLAARINRFVNLKKISRKEGEDAGKLKIKVEELALLQKAHIKATTRETINQVKSIDEIFAAEINVRVDTGDARAKGPGLMTSTRDSKEKEKKEPASAADALISSRSGLSYTGIAFDGDITGNVYQRKAVIRNNVRCVHGPVDSWERKFDPDGKSILDKEVYVNCDELTFNQWEPSGRTKPVVELAAKGNTEIEGKKFRSTADELSFAEETDIVSIRGESRRNAKIWFRKNDNQPWQYAEAKRFRYQKGKSEILDSEDLKEMRFLQFEAPNRRRR